MDRCTEEIKFLDVEDFCPKDKCYIYVLLDPITNEIRYVGRTIYRLSKRLNCHCCLNGTRSLHRYYNRNWIKSLLDKNLKPIMRVIDVVDRDNWRYYEKFYISSLKEKGYRLTNISEGGLGNTRSSAKKWTEEQKQNKKDTLYKREFGISLVKATGEVILSNSNISYISNYLNIRYKTVNNHFRTKTLIDKRYYLLKDGESVPTGKRKYTKYKVLNIEDNSSIIIDSLTEVSNYTLIPISTLSRKLKHSHNIKNFIIQEYYE